MSEFTEALQVAAGDRPPAAASQDRIDATLHNLREAASEFKAVMIGSYALYEIATSRKTIDTGYQGIFRYSKESLRVDHPVWLVRGKTDYSGRMLETEFNDTEFFAANGRSSSYIVKKRRSVHVAVSAINGAICTVQKTTAGTGQMKGMGIDYLDEKAGTDNFQVWNFGVVSAGELFDVATATPATLKQVENDWQADLLAAATHYKRVQAVRPEDYNPTETVTSLYFHN